MMLAYHNNGSWNYVGDRNVTAGEEQTNKTRTVDDVRIFKTVLMSLVISVTSTGNALVILGFMTNKKLRTSSSFTLPLYFNYYIINGEWVLGRSICKFWLTVDYTLCQCTIYNIVLISCDRFMAVTKAVKYRDQQHKLKPALMKMAVVWIIAFLNFGPAIVFWEYVVGYSVIPENECNPEFFYGGRYMLYSSIFDFFTPISIIVFFNLSIYFNIRSRMKGKVQNSSSPSSSDLYGDKRNNDVFVIDCRDHSHCPQASTQRNEESGAENKKGHLQYLFSIFKTKSHHSAAKNGRNEEANGGGTLDLTKNSALAKDKQMAKSLAILVITFCICWAPYSFLTIVAEGFCNVCVSPLLYDITNWLFFLNSSINPFLYPFCHPAFKKTLLQLICFKKT